MNENEIGNSEREAHGLGETRTAYTKTEWEYRLMTIMNE
jgi:hypothetical protein